MIQLTASDPCTAHRLGKKPIAQGPDRRQIIAKLCRRSLKQDIIFASKNIRSSYVNESLTHARSTTFYILHQIRKAHFNLVVRFFLFDRRMYAHTKDPNRADFDRDLTM